MIKLRGSRIIKIQCFECDEISPEFKVTLADDDIDGLTFFSKCEPENWEIPDDEGLVEDIIYGYCPEHQKGK